MSCQWKNGLINQLKLRKRRIIKFFVYVSPKEKKNLNGSASGSGMVHVEHYVSGMIDAFLYQVFLILPKVSLKSTHVFSE